MKGFDWMSDPQYLAQVGHFFGATTVVLTAGLLTLHWTPVLIVWAGGVALASFKEFVFDTASWGEGDSWADSAMDWAFYMLGGIVALGLVALQRGL